MKNKLPIFSFIYFIVATVLFAALSVYFCSGTYTYMEHWRTFYYDANYLQEQILQVGGFSRLLADFICQFFYHPTQGILLNALILACISLESRRYLNRIAKSGRVQLLALIPAIALLIAQTRNNYLYEGTISMLLMLIGLNLRQKISNTYLRRIYTLFITILLYWLAGPIVMLFALTLLVSRFSPFAFFPFAISFLLGGISLQMGVQGSLDRILSPLGFFSIGTEANMTIVWLPWILWLVTLVIALLVRHLYMPQWLYRNLIPLQVFLVIGFAIAGPKSFIDQRNEFYKKLQNLCRNEAWKDVIKECDTHPMDNLLFVNCRNLALAETGQLAKRFKEVRGANYQCLMVEEVVSANISAMIADIYYTMGYISLSQLAAFETNQQMHNLSPRMLQILAKTNLIYGEYRVAAKYLDWLSKTHYYADWAEHYKSMLYNDAAIEKDPELGNKRRCLPAENFFTGAVSKIDALARIAEQNPGHQTTLQYLQAIYQLR